MYIHVDISRQYWDVKCTHMGMFQYSFGVATISRLLKKIGLFCKRAL